MKFVKLAAFSIFALATVAASSASGDGPSTRPATSPSSPVRVPGPNAQMRRALRALGGARPSAVRPYTQQEWDDMMTFLNQYSPARAHVLASVSLPENSPMRLEVIRRWRNYNITRENFPAAADEMLLRFKREDDLFLLMLKAQADITDSIEIREKIHDKVAQIVQLDLDERQTRIDRLKKMLDEETQRLSHDQSMENQLIDQRTAMYINRLGMSHPAQTAPATRPANQGTFQDVSDPNTTPPPTDHN